MSKKNGINPYWIKSKQKTLNKISEYISGYQNMKDPELSEKTTELKERYKNGESLDKLLPEAYALVSEAAYRTTAMRPYPVQLLAGIALHEGRLVQQNTGEGKTLTAALPSYLNALSGNGVHVVTVNDYLVRRDAENIGRIHSFLGLTVGCVYGGTTPTQKREAYACDITYVTNTELGFDYLRDNMVKHAEDAVLRDLNYCIIDEVDSVMIDEARTPLIISGNGKDVSRIFTACDVLAKKLERGQESKEFNRADAIAGEKFEETGDFIVHEKEKNVTLTEAGVKKVEEFFHIDCYASDKHIDIQHVMDQALKANYIMKRDKDYIVREQEVLIVDEFTGRIMEGREYSDGLHQAIQAKEGVPVKERSQTIASTTYQNFFPLYRKLAGLTGTAYTERKEFKEIYGLKTVVIPTNKPNIRIDHPDQIYFTKDGKFNAVVKTIQEAHEKGQPVLAGTASVETSEMLSGLLKQLNITHEVLNAKQDKKEAEIIAKAGKYGAVTIATNMAGRGTDIILDDKAREACGLKVIGTEKHESRRIDNQLKGRAGRQGDPGESVFYISVEDDMARLFGNEKLKNAMIPADVDDSEPITSKFFRKAMECAQKKVEDDCFGSRKNICDFDRINNAQRLAIYEARHIVLETSDFTDMVHDCLINTVTVLIKESYNKKHPEFLVKELNDVFYGLGIREEDVVIYNKKKLTAFVVNRVLHSYELNQEKATTEVLRAAFLNAIDLGWTEQLQALDFLRKDIIYLQYAQKDVKSMYSIEAYAMYKRMCKGIFRTASHLIFRNTSEIKTFRIVKDLEMGIQHVYATTQGEREETTGEE